MNISTDTLHLFLEVISGITITPGAAPTDADAEEAIRFARRVATAGREIRAALTDQENGDISTVDAVA